MRLKVWGVLLAVVVLPTVFAANTGCFLDASGFCDDPGDDCSVPREPNSYTCSCDCAPAQRSRTLRVSFSEDDGEQRLPTKVPDVLLNVPVLTFQNAADRRVALRFRDVGIPQGASILSANVLFTAAETTGGLLNLLIAGEKVPDAPVFDMSPASISALPITMATENWNVPDWMAGDALMAQRTIDIKLIIQEIVNQGMWAEGNALALIFQGTAGTGIRKAHSFDGKPDAAAVLSVNYTEPTAPSVGPQNLQVCMPAEFNQNLMGGVAPSDDDLIADCGNGMLEPGHRVQTTISDLSLACKYPSVCKCSVVADSQRFAAKCNETCTQNLVDNDCSDFDPVNGNVTATNTSTDSPVCLAFSPLASALFGRRSSCAVSGKTTIGIEGEDPQDKSTTGIVQFVGTPCPAGGCSAAMEYFLNIAPITFSNFFGAVTFQDLAGLGESTAGHEAMIDTNGDGTFLAHDALVSAQGRLDTDKRGITTSNQDVIDINIGWASDTPTCSVKGALIGSIDPAAKRCDSGPHAGELCLLDAQCADMSCGMDPCSCVAVSGDSNLSLTLDIGGTIMNQPPTADAGEPQTVECATSAVTPILLDGSGSSDPDDNIKLFSWLLGSRTGTEVGFDEMSKVEQAQSQGSQTYVLRVIDEFGQSDEDTTTVTIEDTIPPVLSCSVAHPVVNQTNHYLINVGFKAKAIDKCEGELPLTVQVFGDEDDQESTAGFPPFLTTGILNRDSPDAKNLAPGTLRLRAERKGNSNGRVYLMVVRATDGSSNSAFNCCTMAVPLSTKQSAQTSAIQQAAAAKAYCLAHNGMPPAGYFVIGDGPVIGPKQ